MSFSVQIRDIGGDRERKLRTSNQSIGSQDGTVHRHQDHQVSERLNDPRCLFDESVYFTIQIHVYDHGSFLSLLILRFLSRVPIRFCSILKRHIIQRTSLQEQKEIPSSGARRSGDLGTPQEEGFGGERVAQCDTHARILLL